jgi:hypothetical protein
MSANVRIRCGPRKSGLSPAKNDRIGAVHEPRPGTQHIRARDPGRVTLEFRELTYQQQVNSLDYAGEVGDGRFAAAMDAPDGRQQLLTYFGRNQRRARRGWLGESGQRFNRHGSFFEQVRVRAGPHKDDGLAI